MYLREVGWGFMNWINLAQDMDQKKALVRSSTKYCAIPEQLSGC
jgi:hypothetical protein